MDIEAAKKELKSRLNTILIECIDNSTKAGLSEREALAWILPEFMLISVYGLKITGLSKEEVFEFAELMYDD